MLVVYYYSHRAMLQMPPSSDGKVIKKWQGEVVPSACTFPQFVSYVRGLETNLTNFAQALDTSVVSTFDSVKVRLRSHVEDNLLDPADAILDGLNCK